MSPTDADPFPFRARSAASVLVALLALLAAAGCAGAPSVLDPAGAPADRLATLSWILIVAAAAVFVAVTAMLLWPVLRPSRRRAADDPAGDGESPGGRRELSPLSAEESGPGPGRMILIGSGISVAILAGLFGLTVIELGALSGGSDRADVVVEVVGHRWWWEVRYPRAPAGAAGGEPVVTANEIHVPVGERVRVRVTTSDVIHSFWVPRLTGKIDLIPGKVNDTWLRADEAGVYHGACAEYCGLQHANMMLQVVAEPPGEFRAWLRRQARPAQPPGDELARRGMRVVTGGACGGCHTIRGTAAQGQAGPDLTHFAGRNRLAAGMFPNERGYLAAWVVDAQSLKPGALMPSVDEYDGRTLRAVVAYLESLD